MARSWAEFLGDAEGPYETEVTRRGFAARLRDSLSRSRRALTEQIVAVAFDPSDAASWERLEEALLTADVGVSATAELVRRLEARQDLTDFDAALAEEIAALLGAPPTLNLDHRPAVILVVGVNGTGKTTTISKLAQKPASTAGGGARVAFRAAAEAVEV
jgi:fused signal recognition particle receptor